MTGHVVDRLSLRHPRTSNNKRDIDIFLIGTSFSWRETVLSDVEAIIASIHNVRIIEQVVLLEASHSTINEVVDSLQCL